MKCFEHIFESSPNELAGGGHSRTMHYEFTHCIWPLLIKVRLHTAILSGRFRILVDVIDVQR